MTTPNPEAFNWVFFGTDIFATTVLDELLKLNLTPALIITTPDRPAGRKLILTPPPVKIWAKKNKTPFLQPESLKDFDLSSLHTICGLSKTNLDFALVASYGRIIPKQILDFFSGRVLNIHPSLLPQYRGATPLESALLSGEPETGVTIMEIDEEMDHGPLIAQKHLSLSATENYFSLRSKAATAGAKLFSEIIKDYLQGTIKPKAQNHTLATYTKKISKADGELNLNDDPILNYRKIRAYADWPGTYFFITGNNERRRVIIKEAHLENDQLIIDRVLPEGKKEMSWGEYKRNL